VRYIGQKFLKAPFINYLELKGLAIGGSRFVTFFRLMGFVGEELSGASALHEAEKRSKDYAIICLDRNAMAGLEDEVNALMMRSPNPILMVDPPFEVKERPEGVKSEILNVMRSGLVGGS
jgi:vacuolar-type H+-ATPase subunit F/Vma7